MSGVSTRRISFVKAAVVATSVRLRAEAADTFVSIATTDFGANRVATELVT